MYRNLQINWKDWRVIPVVQVQFQVLKNVKKFIWSFKYLQSWLNKSCNSWDEGIYKTYWSKGVFKFI